MGHDLDREESAKVMSVASDMRPDENFHHDPKLATPAVPKGREISDAESAAILSLAANVRPFENHHSDEPES